MFILYYNVQAFFNIQNEKKKKNKKIKKKINPTF
jgi:hypothetical protein